MLRTNKLKDLKSIRRKMLSWLARREYSRAELFQKLKHQGVPQDVIEAVLQEFQDKNLQNDHRFVEDYLTSRLRRGYGPLRIRQDLQNKGIDESLIHTALSDNLISWVTYAEQARRKRFDGVLPQDYQSRLKQMRFLQTRGFAHEHIQSLIKGDE